MKVTPGVYGEFMKGTVEQRALRRAFLSREGVTRISAAEMQAIRSNPVFKSVVDKSTKAGKSLVDAELAGTAAATGQQLVTSDANLLRNLSNAVSRIPVMYRNAFLGR